ncbi:MAG TPA: copper amine oxidase N-terminal domain-containing protein [Pseudobacteroides sp.]|uniref:copper amine oxidase N-terminal domain-containing protein n=1 Tax=Pseudobacteroides sp. TaxID=1968840 RepID=UPI002F927CDA
MKKTLLYAVMFITVCIFGVTSHAQQKAAIKEIPTLKIIIDGTQLKPSSTPINYGGRTLVGLRDLLVSLGVQNDSEHIVWDKTNKTIKVLKDSKEISLAIGDKMAVVDGAEVEIDVEPVIYKNSTYIPARFIAQSLSKLVFWDGYTNSVVICDEEMYKEVAGIIGSEASSKSVVIKTTTDTLLHNGKNVYTIKDESKKDPVKNIEFTKSTIDVGGQLDYIDYFENDKYIYRRPDVHQKWLRASKTVRDVDVEDIDSNNNDNSSINAFMASLVVKEKNEGRIVIEGDTLYYAVAMTSANEMDVLKDKTSTSKVQMEYNASSSRLNKIEIKVKGNINDSGTKKSYELTRSIVVNRDESVTSVPVPEDLNNYYTVPEGSTEYYHIDGFFMTVPKEWNFPSMIETDPMISYTDPKDPKKWCSVMPDILYFETTDKSLLNDISLELEKNFKTILINSKVIKKEKLKFQGKDAIRITIKGIDDESKKATKIQLTLFQNLNTVTVFTYMGEEKTFDQKAGEAKKIMDSWYNPGRG